MAYLRQNTSWLVGMLTSVPSAGIVASTRATSCRIFEIPLERTAVAFEAGGSLVDFETLVTFAVAERYEL